MVLNFILVVLVIYFDKEARIEQNLIQERFQFVKKFSEFRVISGFIWVGVFEHFLEQWAALYLKNLELVLEIVAHTQNFVLKFYETLCHVFKVA